MISDEAYKERERKHLERQEEFLCQQRTTNEVGMTISLIGVLLIVGSLIAAFGKVIYESFLASPLLGTGLVGILVIALGLLIKSFGRGDF